MHLLETTRSKDSPSGDQTIRFAIDNGRVFFSDPECPCLKLKPLMEALEEGGNFTIRPGKRPILVPAYRFLAQLEALQKAAA